MRLNWNVYAGGCSVPDTYKGKPVNSFDVYVESKAGKGQYCVSPYMKGNFLFWLARLANQGFDDTLYGAGLWHGISAEGKAISFHAEKSYLNQTDAKRACQKHYDDHCDDLPLKKAAADAVWKELCA